jgi:hypothetical protein
LLGADIILKVPNALDRLIDQSCDSLHVSTRRRFNVRMMPQECDSEAERVQNVVQLSGGSQSYQAYRCRPE